MRGFTVTPDRLAWIGAGLRRPECVLCASDGSLYCSDAGGGVTHIRPDGGQAAWLAGKGAPALMPNGIAMDRDGSFLLADLSDGGGGLWRLHRDGRAEPVLQQVEGRTIEPSNFPMIDRFGRIWLSVSTRRRPRALGYRADVDDGYVVLLDEKGARIAIDGIGYTNELVLDPAGEWLYVNETYGRRLSRYRLGPDGLATAKEVVAEFGHGVYPDGLAFDAEGGAWITSVVSNRVIRVAPDGRQHLVMDDSDPAHVEWVEQAFLAGELGREHLDRIEGTSTASISSLAFGGPDLKTVYLGCLLGDRIACFRSPVAGRQPVHWHWG